MSTIQCKYLKLKHDRINAFGGNQVLLTTSICLQKERSENAKNEIYTRLFDLKVEASIVSFTCPYYEHHLEDKIYPFNPANPDNEIEKFKFLLG